MWTMIRRKSDGKWLGLNMGFQEKWLVDRKGAWRFSLTAKLQPEDVLNRLCKANPKETYELKTTETA